MEIRISSPKHYESMHGSSDIVRAYLDQIEQKLGEAIISEAIEILRVSLLIAHPEELAQGKFLAYEKYDWRCGYAAVGVNGNYERYHLGDDLVKISELSEMLQSAFCRIGKMRKAQFDSTFANEIVNQITYAFLEKYFRK